MAAAFHGAAAGGGVREEAAPLSLRRRRGARRHAGALVLAAVSVGRVFASWPKFLNAAVSRPPRRLPVYLWVGEAPAPHLGDVRKDSKHDDDPHVKIAATAVLLGHLLVPVRVARDLDLVVEGRAVRDPMAATHDALSIHDEGRVDVAVPCTAHGGRHRLRATKLLRPRRAGREELPGPLARPPLRRGEVVPPVARRRVPRGRRRRLLEIRGRPVDREPHAHGEAARAQLPVSPVPDVPLAAASTS